MLVLALEITVTIAANQFDEDVRLVSIKVVVSLALVVISHITGKDELSFEVGHGPMVPGWRAAASDRTAIEPLAATPEPTELVDPLLPQGIAN